MLDKIEINLNMIWKFYDTAKNTDYDILPVEASINLYWKIRESFKMKYGPTQVIKGEKGEVAAGAPTLLQCQRMTINRLNTQCARQTAPSLRSCCTASRWCRSTR